MQLTKEYYANLKSQLEELLFERRSVIREIKECSDMGDIEGTGFWNDNRLELDAQIESKRIEIESFRKVLADARFKAFEAGDYEKACSYIF